MMRIFMIFSLHEIIYPRLIQEGIQKRKHGREEKYAQILGTKSEHTIPIRSTNFG